MSDITLCPKCGSLAGWSSYFKRYECSKADCDWVGVDSKYEANRKFKQEFENNPLGTIEKLVRKLIGDDN